VPAHSSAVRLVADASNGTPSGTNSENSENSGGLQIEEFRTAYQSEGSA